MSPIANYDSNSGNVTPSYDPSSVWDDRSAWGRSLRLGCTLGLGRLGSQR